MIIKKLRRFFWELVWMGTNGPQKKCGHIRFQPNCKDCRNFYKFLKSLEDEFPCPSCGNTTRESDTTKCEFCNEIICNNCWEEVLEKVPGDFASHFFCKYRDCWQKKHEYDQKKATEARLKLKADEIARREIEQWEKEKKEKEEKEEREGRGLCRQCGKIRTPHKCSRCNNWTCSKCLEDNMCSYCYDDYYYSS